MKDYLICIDSDGCAIDSMEIKHRRCFGPCLIDIWQLKPWQEKILQRWNEINLYSMTRGINRFQGLALMLKEIDEGCRPIDGLSAYCRWCQTTPSFSNAAVQRQIQSGGHPIFAQVLMWSESVNRSIERIAGEIRPFPGVQQALKAIRESADIAIVSSANLQAVQSEWERFGFMGYVNHVMAQDAGTKSDCIRRMIDCGYDASHILMLGDAPGDQQAAAANGVLFYPILAGHETESWQRFSGEMLPELLSGQYGSRQQLLLTRFRQNLGDL